MENNENQSFPQELQNNGSSTPMQIPLPNSSGILIMGILSIVTCCCYGIVGVILAVVSLVLASKAIQLFYEHPGIYTESSLKNVQTGKVCAIIGLILAILFIILMIIYFVVFGFAMSSMDWQEVIEQLDQM